MKSVAMSALLGGVLSVAFYLLMQMIYPIVPIKMIGLISFVFTLGTVHFLIVMNTKGFIDFWNVGTPAIEKLYSLPKDQSVSSLGYKQRNYSFYRVDGSTSDDQDEGDVDNILSYLLKFYSFSVVYGPADLNSDSPKMVYRLGVIHQGKCDLALVFPERVQEISLGEYTEGLSGESRIFHGKKQGLGDPAVVMAGEFSYLPLVVDRFNVADSKLLEGFKTRFGQNIQVIMHSFACPIGKKEKRQIGTIGLIESMLSRKWIKKGMEDIEAKEEVGKDLDGLALVQTILWFRFKTGEFSPSVLKKQVQVVVGEHLDLTTLSPYEALNQFVGFLPWLGTVVNSKTGSGTVLEKESAAKVLKQNPRWCGNRGGTKFLIPGTGPNYQLKFSPFESGENYNILIAGTSGSGKSVLLGQMIMDHLSEDPENDCIAVEFGGSFANLAEKTGGQFIDKESDFKLSPFPSEDANSHELGNLLDTSFSLIFNFLLEVQPEKRLEPAMREMFNEAFMGVADRNRIFHVISEMILALDARKDSEMLYKEAQKALRDSLLSLKALVKQQEFLGDSQGYTQRLLVFDLDGFGSNEVRSLVGLIRLMIQERMFKRNRVGKTLVVYDEAHYYLLTSDQTLNLLGVSVQQDLRVSRKHLTCIAIATQCLEDYGKSSIAQNTSHKILLKVPGVPAKKDLPVGLHIPERDVEVIRTFRAAKSQGYSSLWLSTLSDKGAQSVILGLRVEKKLLYLLISDKKAKLQMRRAVERLGLKGIGELVEKLDAVREELVWPGGEVWDDVMDELGAA